jgi:ATP-dependent Clp protease ATP-binding subunit ClpA
VYRFDDLQGIPPVLRKGSRTGAAVPEDRCGEPTVPDAIKILKGLKPYFEDFHSVRYTERRHKGCGRTVSKYINDRKLPDKAIDVIDETGASQMLVPENRRKKTIGVKEVENAMRRWRAFRRKPCPSNDAGMLQNLEQTLKRVVYGQDKAIEALSAAIKLARAGLREPKSRSAITCSRVQPASARPRWPSSSRSHGRGIAALRYVRIYGAAYDLTADRCASGLCRVRSGWPAHRWRRPASPLRAAAGRDRKGPSGPVQRALQVMDHGKLTDHNGKQVDFRNVI